ncbi:hypothetical protein R75461_05282 [Paraburkholderia nemoris]|uniref:terminase small subunit-like protein n=1 Tax=Paraburkholderia nemoris TaxID=2793076 RepID=UPI00190D9CF9|nr:MULTISPECIES: hypothetical protein [Paraburkholderia]MBK3783941.1 hypothetical protein [Paraburkholderia aspalathi]CAE6803072.1 hypothetical protein R75461_05282 [Paraburkholderia nemoris]
MKFTNKSAQSQIATQSIAQKPEAQTPPAKAKRTRKRITNVGYAPEIFERIFQYVAAGETLAEACRRPGLPNVTTVRRRMQVDDKLFDTYRRAESIKVRAMVEDLPTAGARALEGQQKVSTADRLAAAKLDSDNTKWMAARLLSEFQGLEDGGGTVTLNIIGAPDAPPAPAGTPSKPYTPPGQPVLKIVGAPVQSIAQDGEQGND